MSLAGAARRPAAADLRGWLERRLLAFWLDAGRDRLAGGFVERLQLDGRPAPDAYKRVRVQTRQVHVACSALLLTGSAPAAEAAAAGLDFLTRCYWDRDRGGWIRSATREGAALDRTRDLYEQSFALLAFASAHRAGAHPSAADWAGRTLDHLDAAHAAAADGGWGGYAEEAGAAVLPRRQNPHMHLLEALLALHEAQAAPGALERAGRVVDLLLRRFLDPATGGLVEFFDAGWSPADGPPGRVREPGHHFEWVWLLLHYRRLSGDDRVLAPADRLYRFALRHGRDRRPGRPPAFFDEVDPLGRPLRTTKRLWVQTEALKAFLARWELLGDAEARALAEAQLDLLFDWYIGPEEGLWREHLAEDGRNLAGHVPATTLYHLVSALTEAARILK